MSAYEMMWKICPRFPDYEVSEFGDVRTCKIVGHHPVGFRPKAYISSVGGYVVYSLRAPDGNFSNVHAYRLVAEAFLGPPPSPKHEVAHNSGSKISAYWRDLRWATATENMNDKAVHLSSAGIRNGRAKLTDADVREIRKEYARIKSLPKRTNRSALLAMCAHYSISESNADMIGTRVTWRHVGDEE